MADRFLSFLGICKKAGKLSMGFESSMAAITSERAKLCILCKDASDRTAKQFRLIKENFEKLDIINTEYTKDDIEAVFKTSAGVLTVNDTGFAKKAIQIYSSSTGEDNI